MTDSNPHVFSDPRFSRAPPLPSIFRLNFPFCFLSIMSMTFFLIPKFMNFFLLRQLFLKLFYKKTRIFFLDPGFICCMCFIYFAMISSHRHPVVVSSCLLIYGKPTIASPHNGFDHVFSALLAVLMF